MDTISATLVAYDRLETTLDTLSRIVACDPPPAEVLVHVDGDQEAVGTAIRKAFPQARVHVNPHHVGPGGGRNWLLRQASGSLVASFDDDSYPQDPGYFGHLQDLASKHPDVAIFAAHITEPHQSDSLAHSTERWVADFVGCGCAYRREYFQEGSAYVPLPVAYGMEEADLALRMHARGYRILYSPKIRVHHNSPLSHHQLPRIASKQLTNTALLPFLRYPWYLIPIGMVQFGRKLWDTLKRKRFMGALIGIGNVLPYLYHHRHRREPLAGKAVLSFLALRRHAQPVVHGSS